MVYQSTGVILEQSLGDRRTVTGRSWDSREDDRGIVPVQSRASSGGPGGCQAALRPQSRGGPGTVVGQSADVPGAVAGQSRACASRCALVPKQGAGAKVFQRRPKMGAVRTWCHRRRNEILNISKRPVATLLQPVATCKQVATQPLQLHCKLHFF